MTSWARELDYRVLPLLAKLPVGLAYRAAEVRGKISFILKKATRDRCTANLSRVLPTLSPREVVKVLAGQFKTSSVDELESYWLDRERAFFEDRVQIDGLESLIRARDSDRGVVLYAGHLGCTGMALIRLSQILALSLVFRHTDSVPGKPVAWYRLARHRVKRLEASCRRPLIFTGSNAYFQMRSRLKEGEAVMVGIDVPPTKNCVRVQFFGVPALFPAGPARLFLDCRPRALFWSVHQSPQHRHRIEVHDLTGRLEAAPDLQSVAQILVDRLERQIREYPEDWLMWEAADQFFQAAAPPA